jgi:uncharacterized protein YbbK (DUF523 family)
VGVSACLLGQEVRWDGRHKRAEWVAGALAREAELVPVCPEVEIGLGTPRPPIRLEDAGGGRSRLACPSTGEDLTRRMAAFSEARIRALRDAGLCGYVLKARSPSCGKEGVDVFGPEGAPPRPVGRGAFADALIRLLPGLPVEEEEALRDPAARRDFLERARAYDRARRDA